MCSTATVPVGCTSTGHSARCCHMQRLWGTADTHRHARKTVYHRCSVVFSSLLLAAVVSLPIFFVFRTSFIQKKYYEDWMMCLLLDAKTITNCVLVDGIRSEACGGPLPPFGGSQGQRVVPLELWQCKRTSRISSFTSEHSSVSTNETVAYSDPFVEDFFLHEVCQHPQDYRPLGSGHHQLVTHSTHT